MSASPENDITQLLRDPQLTSAERAERLLPLVYEHLRGIARQRMAGERADHTLQPTALVHEAYLRLVGERDLAWQNRAHFFGAAAEAMRRILIDRARQRRRARHGGDRQRVNLDRVDPAAAGEDDRLLALDDALARLAQQHPAKAEMVKLRYFAGLSIEEAAEVLGVSRATTYRYWEYARAWLLREMEGTPPAVT